MRPFTLLLMFRNIFSLRRNGLGDDGVYGITDDLFYEYAGNRLLKVTDAAEGHITKVRCTYKVFDNVLDFSIKKNW